MSNLPLGTITFLFTQIAHNAHLWATQPAAMKVLRNRHDAILRDAIRGQGGHLVTITEDGLYAVFTTARAALDAALAAQTALHAAATETSQLRVQMGLHTGAAEWQADEYTGAAVRRASRVMAVAHGGQLLLSQTAYALVQDQLPEGVQLCSLGEHRLPGLLNPEALWQVVAPGLPVDFPPLASLNAIPNNLPIQMTSFIGRENAIATIKALLLGENGPTSNVPTRLLTLTGAGGAGKTRLSLQVAAEVLERFPDGVWWIELATLNDPTLIVATVAGVLGLSNEPGRPLLSTLYDWLRSKRLLLILDNCEHLLDACARFASGVLQQSATVQLFASSREALGMAGEVIYAVPPLLLPPLTPIPPPVETLSQYEAVRLFIERARLVQPSFQVTNLNAPAIAQICHRLDGIPLALELAAARLKALPVEKIAERLEDRFRLLTSGNRTALPHHQTLRALVDWSYDLLSEPERVLLRRLAVFAGGWTLEAAEAICGEALPQGAGWRGTQTWEAAVPALGLAGLDAHDVLDLLARLVEKSLVVLDKQASAFRYHLLETIRQYAYEKLTTAQESSALSAQHFHFFAALLTEAEPWFNRGRRAAWMEHLAPEQDNLRAALAWAQMHDPEAALQMAGRLRWFWFFNGHLVEAHTWYSRLLTPTPPPVTPPAATYGRGLALLGAGLIDLFLGAHGQGVEWLKQSMAIWQQLDQPAGLSEAVGLQAYGLGHLGEFTQLCTLMTQHEALLRRVADPLVLAYALSFWGWALSFVQPDSPHSQALQEEALALGQQWQDAVVLGLVYLNLGRCTFAQRDYAATRRYFEAVLASQHRGGLPWMLGLATVLLADVIMLQGDYAAARPLFDEALAVMRAAGQQMYLAYSLARLAHLTIKQGDLAGAIPHLEASLALYRALGVPDTFIHCVLGYAELRLAQGHAALTVRVLACATLRQSPFPQDRIIHQQILDGARAQLTPPAFEQAWAAGQGLTLDDALALAQIPVESVAPASPTPAPAPTPPKSTGRRQTLGLSTREGEVAVLIAQGHSNRTIATTLVLSERTVENHVANILNKLGFTSRSQIAAWVVAQGLAKTATG
ncbi:MAG: LuxR C-terminal-related transcriptional regulator [Caldilineaceae bacterium]